MKIWQKSFVSGMRFFQCALFALSTAITVVQSQAEIYTLSDINSVAEVDVSSSAGFYSWEVDGVDQLNQQWFYYRIGDSGPESPINSISSPTVTLYDSRHLDVVYSNPTYSVDVLYILTGNSTGSGNSGINETVTVKNLSSDNLPLRFFQYSDFDLGGASEGQTAKFYKTGPNYNKATQTVGSLAFTNLFTSIKPITKVEAALYDQTLQSLTDGGPTTLNGVANAGPGNVTFTTEWDVSLSGVGQSLAVSEILTLQVPEPSALALISSGILALALLQRRRRAA